MFSIICGAALIAISSASFWHLLPRNGRLHPLVNKIRRRFNDHDRYHDLIYRRCGLTRGKLYRLARAKSAEVGREASFLCRSFQRAVHLLLNSLRTHKDESAKAADTTRSCLKF
jgi:hypothetical protein